MIAQYRISVGESQFPYSHHLAEELFDALKGMGVQGLSLAYVGKDDRVTHGFTYGFSFFGERGRFQVELMKNGGAVEMTVQIDGSANRVSPEAVKATLEEVMAQHREPASSVANNGFSFQPYRSGLWMT